MLGHIVVCLGVVSPADLTPSLDVGTEVLQHTGGPGAGLLTLVVAVSSLG